MIRIFSVIKQGVNNVVAFIKCDTIKFTADNTNLKADLE